MQILERIRERRDTVGPDEFSEGDLIAGLRPDVLDLVGRHRIPALVLRHLRVDLGVRHLRREIRDLADSPVLDLPSVFDLTLETVAVCDRHVAHIVAERRDAGAARQPDRLRHLREPADLRQHVIMLVVPCDDLMADPQLRENEAELAVPVGCLIEVHEIHVDCVIGQPLVCLRMQMQQRLPEQLKALDPHLGRREGMHPCDDADAVVVHHDLLHVLHADRGGLHGRQQLDADHIPELFIQKIRHALAVRADGREAFLAVEILTARNKIQFFHFIIPPYRMGRSGPRGKRRGFRPSVSMKTLLHHLMICRDCRSAKTATKIRNTTP